MTSRVLIAGAGRSGTGYTAAVLKAAGVTSGHENVFHPETPPRPIWREYRTESSWLCVPWLSTLDEDTDIIHLVRDPLANARSFHGLGMFRIPALPGHSRFITPIERFAPGVMTRSTELERWLAYWVVWNETIERFASRRWRIEDLAKGSELVDYFSDRGISSRQDLQRAIDRVPTNTNSRTRDEKVELGQIWALDPALVARYSALCRHYGYMSSAKPE